MKGEIGVGVIGLGFMGRTHVDAYRAAAEAGFANRLVAVCDKDPDRRAGRSGPAGNLEAGEREELVFDPSAVRAYAEASELLADPDVQVVSVCTHTTTHVDLGIAALEAGKHVLVEKPIAVSLPEVERLAAAAREARTSCMPALCIRFWPGWSWVLERVADGSLGAVQSAVFQRLATPPGWSVGFYGDSRASGGALYDLHVHDVDFVRACFGDPASVTSTGSLDHVTTLFHYPEGPSHVVAEGGWDHSDGFPFRMRFTVVFEGGTAEYDSSWERPLRLSRAGECRTVEIEPWAGYDGEIRHLLECVARGVPPSVTVDDAVAHTRIIEAERRSLEGGARVEL